MKAVKLRVLVVDDSTLYRNTISRIVRNQPGMQVVAEADDGLAAVQAVENHRPDVVLMHISTPISNGLDATRAIKFKFPETRVIILTVHNADSIAEAARKAGADLWLNKDCPLEEILQAINNV